ncbi:MAG: YIP1 family protein [Cyanobacteria bacterium REEB65]|nr:YIP1 family protein [Cyanobacteria bacterium REEB65]
MLLDSLYRSLFRPMTGALDLDGATAIALFALVAVTLALPDAGRLGLDGFGAFWLCLGIFALILAGWFWLGAAMALVARLMGGSGTIEQTLGAFSQACWPLLLLAPAVGAGNAGLIPVRNVATAAVAVWVSLLLVAFIRRVHNLSWFQALLSWILLLGAIGASAIVVVLIAAVLATATLAT